MISRFYGHVALLAVVAVCISLELSQAAPRTQRGYAAYYRPGLMDRVSHNRGLPVVSCMIASPTERIGTWLTVTSRRGQRRCRVTDVCHPRDCRAIQRRGIVVELSYEINRVLCRANHPPRECIVEVRP